MKYKLLLIAFIVFCFENKAYNEDNHARITRCAVDLLNKYLGYEFITQAEAEKIVNGNCSEDHFGLKWLNRYWNQHFYNPLKTQKEWRRGKSIDVRFDRIVKRCYTIT